MHRVDHTLSRCRFRTGLRRPPQRAATRSSARRVVRAAVSGSVAAPSKARKPRLAAGTSVDATTRQHTAGSVDEGSKTGAKRKPANVRPAQASDTLAIVRLAEKTTHRSAPKRAKTGIVESVVIRPSASVISRRTQAKRPPIHHLPHQPVVPFTPPAWMLAECQVSPARAGEQNEILQLLSGLPTPPSRAEFHAAVDHPEHDSANRLVARIGGRIIGHAEIIPRTILLGNVPVSGALVDRVAVLPECRGAGHGQRLVQAAEVRMRQSGAVVALSRTRIAATFRELGWSVLGRDCATPGRPTEILSRILETPRWNGETVTMRQWRHVELPAILRIYGQNARRFVGPLERDENYGRWLVSRGAFDSILVALVGQDRYEIHEQSARIVGYCIQAGTRVLEIMADPEFAGLEREILARVCAEAIENDRQEIVYESGASDPLHAAVAGGDSQVAQGDRMIVARVFQPKVLLEAIAPLVAERVVAAGIRETVELGLDAPSFRGSIIVAEEKGDARGERPATVHPGRVGRSYLKLADEELARLLLGQCDPTEAVAAGRMEPSTQMAQKLAGQLFPRQPLWCPMWDDLPA